MRILRKFARNLSHFTFNLAEICTRLAFSFWEIQHKNYPKIILHNVRVAADKFLATINRRLQTDEA
jgi:hypothetical protein